MLKNIKLLALFSYGILLFIGSWLGHRHSIGHTGQVSSLISSILILVASLAFYRNQAWGLILGFVTTGCLVVFFAYRYFITGHFLPPGLLSLISLGILCALALPCKKKI